MCLTQGHLYCSEYISVRNDSTAGADGRGGADTGFWKGGSG